MLNNAIGVEGYRNHALGQYLFEAMEMVVNLQQSDIKSKDDFLTSNSYYLHPQTDGAQEHESTRSLTKRTECILQLKIRVQRNGRSKLVLSGFNIIVRAHPHLSCKAED